MALILMLVLGVIGVIQADECTECENEGHTINCCGKMTKCEPATYTCTGKILNACSLPDACSFPNGKAKQGVDWTGNDMVWFKCNEGFALVGSPFLICSNNHWNGSLPVCAAKDCMAHRSAGRDQDGVYGIVPDDKVPRLVYCDMTTDGGGWTVFQRRVDGTVNFYRGYEEYQRGFGNLDGNLWLGLDLLHILSEQDSELYIDMVANDTHKAYARYDHFMVSSEAKHYKLSVSGYSGNAGDSLAYQNGQNFTTHDRDQDTDPKANCAQLYKGGWWYKACHYSNLNGLYHNGKHASYAEGINWKSYTSYYYSLKQVSMMLRRKFA